MKQFNRRELLLRIVAASAEAILFYLGYMFINQIFVGSKVNVLFFIIVALGGLLANLLPYNSSDKRKQSMFYSIVGLVLASIVTAIIAIMGTDVFLLPIDFAILVWLYYRANMSYLSNVLYIYTIGDFNKSLGLLFFMNVIAVYFTGIYAPVLNMLLRYTVLYIVMGLYTLTEIKNFKYVSKSENGKKSAFDIFATGFMIALTVIMSIPKVFSLAIKPFALVFGFVYGLMTKLLILVSTPFGMGLSAISKLLHVPDWKSIEGQIGRGNSSIKPPENTTYNNIDPNTLNLLQIIGRVLTYLFLLALCIFILYLLFKFIDRQSRSKINEDFEEDREFISKNKNSKGPGFLKRLGETVKKAAGDIAFILTANNADKLRNEYKDFIKKLHGKKIIENYNYTALEILDITSHKTPSETAVLESITSMYEEVRYGVKYPEDNELKTFRRNLAEASKVILQSQ